MKRIAFIVLMSCTIIRGIGHAETAAEEYDRLRTIGLGEAVVGHGVTGTDLESNGEQTLDDYLVHAALHNPELEAAFYRWKAALEKVPRAGVFPEPRLTYAYYVTSVETRVGPQRHKLDLSQTFPWFGTGELRSRVSLDEAGIEWERLQTNRLALERKVRSAFYDLFVVKRTAEVVGENLRLLESGEQVALTRYTSGTGAYADLIRIQVELSRLEERLAALNDLFLTRRAAFNALLARPNGAVVTVPGVLQESGISISADSLIASALENNPDISTLERLRSREEAQKELEKKRFYPDITVGLSWIETGPAVMPGMSGSGTNPIMPMISLSLPVNRCAYRSAVREAELRRRATEKTLDDRANGVTAEVRNALFKYNDAERKIVLFRDTLVPKIHQAYSVALTAYESGGGDYLKLVDTQATLLELELSAAGAEAARASALADIRYLTGGAFPNRSIMK